MRLLERTSASVLGWGEEDFNLLSNAINYARSAVTVSAGTSGKTLELLVSDDGPGVAPEHLARLAERFFRPDESRAREMGGVGLGLAIVKSLCEAYGGSLALSSELGKGTVARVQIEVDSLALSSNTQLSHSAFDG